MFKEKINILMRENDISSLKELSRQCDIPYTTFIRIYNNGTEKAESKTIKKISKFFDCTLDYLLDDSININDKLHKYKNYLDIWNKAEINQKNKEKILSNIPIEIKNYLDLEYWYHPNEEEYNKGILDYSNIDVVIKILNYLKLLEDNKELNEMELKEIINFILSNITIFKNLIEKEKQFYLENRI